MVENFTPRQQEAFSPPPPNIFFTFGIVRKCMDTQKSGRLVVDIGLPEDVECEYVSPIAGAGYGLFAVPGIGATVLVGQAPHADPPTKYFWMGCLYADVVEQGDMKTQPYLVSDVLDPNKTQCIRTEVMEDGFDDAEPKSTYGIPNARRPEVYGTNNLPDSFILKHPAGHSISLTDKKSDVLISEIKLKTAEGKRLIMSDTPADVGEFMSLIDENNNHITILSENSSNPNSITVRAGQDIEVESTGGDIYQGISTGSGDFSIVNAGNGDVSIKSYQGNVEIEAEKSLLLRCGGSTLLITPTGIDITANNINVRGSSTNVVGDTTNVTGKSGDANIGGISLASHIHGGVEAGTDNTSTPS
jgi:hypothetical protein